MKATDLAWRDFRSCFVGLLILAMVLAGAGYGYYRYAFPYGWTHACDKVLSSALRDYALRHDGWFPRGEETPEASLSLLHPELRAETLHGKSCPIEKTRARLEAGLKLTPETCGWHYVEGLRNDDDKELALFWDKVGLGHNGGRLGSGCHYVWFVDGNREFISGDEWGAFLRNQEELRAKIKRPKGK